MLHDSFAWTVEEACQNACPSPRQVLLEGWLLRAAGGRTRRTNSVSPLRGGPRDPTGIVAAAEAIYGGLGRPTIFRVPALVAGMDAPLARQGYAAEGETCTLFADLAEHGVAAREGVTLSRRPDSDWHAAWAGLSAASAESCQVFRAMVDSLVLPHAFAACRVEGRVVAIAFGVIDRRLLVVESVGTDAAHRQRGHGRRTVGCLMDWARSRGAAGACLQVAAANAPALALYRGLGFDREIYRYHYRRKDPAGRG